MLLKNFDNNVRQFERILTTIAWIATVFVTLITVTDVVLRYFFNKPLPATWEISQVFMPYIVFFAFAETLDKNSHVLVTLVTERLPKTIRYYLRMFTNVCSFLFCLLFTWWSAIRFWKSLIIDEEILAAIYVPWWIGKFAMPVGMGAFALRYLLQVLTDLSEGRFVSQSLGGQEPASKEAHD